MDTKPESVQEEMQEVIAPMDAALEAEPVQEVEQEQEQTVPLAALQKERRKRQDWEQRAKLYEQQQASQLSQRSQPVEDDEDQYEALTKAEAKKKFQSSEAKIIQTVTESIWAKENPEKVTEVNNNLEEFLTQRPHLKLAIEAAPNRYEEAYVLMNALSPKQKAALKIPTPIKKVAPGSPSGAPKAAGINEAVDLSSMDDKEFNAWRKAKRAGNR